jgi:hypothetical protein
MGLVVFAEVVNLCNVAVLCCLGGELESGHV